MKILVTGSAGFIGRHTIELLLRHGHNIIAVDRNGNDSFEGLISGATVGSWRNDILQLGPLKYIFEAERPDTILHLAANSSLQKGIEDPIYDAQNNIIGTINVLQAAKEHGCKRIVFASTSAVYAPKQYLPINENGELNPITPYGISKLACEYYIKASRLDHVILRYGNVFGPGQKPLGENILIARAIAHMIDGDPFIINGDGEQIRDWIYVEDVAMANHLALANKNNFVGTLNISHGFGLSVNLILDDLKQIISYDREFKHGPAIDGELRSVIMDRGAADRALGWLPSIVPYTGLVRTVKAWTAKESESTTPASL